MNKHKQKQAYAGDDFLYGVCYFPEQWPEEMWEDDLKRMAELGMNTVRMGEGAWHLWEPREGQYDFALFDRAIALADKYGLKVILGTPTYAPPAWLTEKYPEVLRADFHRHPMGHGSRRHYNYTSPNYLELCRGVVTALAEHYGHDSRVIGWQIDNEFNCHMDVSFAESDDRAFNEWCQNRYGTLDALNDAWGTSFWAQHYDAWSQVHLPRPTAAYHNPGHLLDFYRFTSDSVVEFSRLQYDILRAKTKDQFITHNGFFYNIDNQKLTDETLDFMSFDSYPAFYPMLMDGPAHFTDRHMGLRLSTVRGMSSKFLILEQQAGPGGQSGGKVFTGAMDYLHASPRKGQMRLWVWQSVAHGADGVLFFRWRTALFGSETLWHGLNHYGNQPSRRYEEARQLGQELGKIGPRLLDTAPVADASILYDYDNESNLRIEQYLAQAYFDAEATLYRTLSERRMLADRVSLNTLSDPQRLDRYKVVFYPNAQILEVADVEALRGYVEQGGTLVFGPRAGYKDRANRCHALPFPGVLRELIELDIPEFTMLERGPKMSVHFQQGSEVEAKWFADILSVPDGKAEVLATYAGGDDTGAPAIASFSIGKGRVVYCGTFLPDTGLGHLYDALGLRSSVDEWASVPLEVEAIRRQGKGDDLLLLLNYSDQAQTVGLHQQSTDLLTGDVPDGELKLAPFGVAVLAGSP